ncbi:hypothetical protein [Streptomyces sp. MP131-18]|uniref:hypothetical protein n=1 Tax=Streptomyces sp. MP131-18 TaxID=1857892 RepID=UPI00097C77B2|nr:hypothetical protein [Streptomyces sp. MP131-18]
MPLPGGPTTTDGHAVNEPLLGALAAAAIRDCTECVDRFLDEIADAPASVARLVEVARLAALRLHRGELPGFFTDDDDRSGPAMPELKHLVRAATAAEPLTAVCEQLTTAQRRAAARDAIEMLVGQLKVANTFGRDESQTLAELCCAISALLVEWCFAAAPMDGRHFSETWRKWSSGRQREARLPGNGIPALALLLGAVLHHQARQDDVPAEQLQDLVFARALPLLQEPPEVGDILKAFAAPPENDSITGPVKRLARSEPQFLSDLCSYARHTIMLHVENCPHGLRETDHACTLAHRIPALTDSTRAPVAAPTTAEGRRVALPRIGIREEEPVEGAPAGFPADHIWQINVDRIVWERYDADIDRFNDAIAEDSTISHPDYEHTTGLEALACPACGSHGPFLVEGRWGDPLTLHCGCGVTVMSPTDSRPDDLGRRVLKRLILCEADPAYAARHLIPQLAKYQEDNHRSRANSWYRGPDDEDVALAEAIDPAAEDLTQALTAALQPRLPDRHGGRALTLLLLKAQDALSTPAVHDSDDGRRLADTVRSLLDDLKEESDRWAPSREPVGARLRTWQQEGGPHLWQAAWGRTLKVASRYEDYRVGDGRLSDGCAALTLALYILAHEANTSVDQIEKNEVLTLWSPHNADNPAEEPAEVPQRWGARLQALGHDLKAPDDPVARLWRHLRTEHTASVLGDRREPALTLGLEHLLGPHSLNRIPL